MLQVEEYYIITAFNELAKKRAEYITKIRGISAMLKPRSYQIHDIIDNNGEKVVLRMPVAVIPDLKLTEGAYLESLAVVQYWLKRLSLREVLVSYKEFKPFSEDTPAWENLAVNKMIARLKLHFSEYPLDCFATSPKDMKESLISKFNEIGKQI
eukprot:NODE_671_length_4854_cov_0.553312.p7 type:complete len:154 gc:universal NODE_671_length_4854_cov_0.553312:334-795(+)